MKRFAFVFILLSFGIFHLISCGGGNNKISTETGVDTAGTSTDFTEEEVMSYLLTQLAGYYMYNDFDVSSGCIYSYCSGSSSQDLGYLFLDTNNKFSFCFSHTDFSSSSTPTSSDSYADYNFWCAYGSYDVTWLLTKEEEWTLESEDIPYYISLTFNIERYLSNKKTYDCYQELTAEMEDNVNKNSVVLNWNNGLEINKWDEEGMQTIGEWERSNNASFNLYTSNNRAAMGVGFDSEEFLLTEFKDCITNDERTQVFSFTLTPLDGTYYTYVYSGEYGDHTSGFYQYEIQATQGEVLYLKPYSSSGYAYLTIVPESSGGYPSSSVGHYTYEPDQDKAHYLMEQYDTPIEENENPESGSIESEEYYISKVNLTYVVPQTGKYLIRFRSAYSLNDEDMFYKNYRDNFYINFESSY